MDQPTTGDALRALDVLGAPFAVDFDLTERRVRGGDDR
jgi:hypothetical protein